MLKILNVEKIKFTKDGNEQYFYKCYVKDELGKGCEITVSGKAGDLKEGDTLVAKAFIIYDREKNSTHVSYRLIKG